MTSSYYRYLTDTSSLLLEDGGLLLLEDGGELLLDAHLYGVTFMTSTLFDLTYKVARELGWLEEGVATAGSTTSLADSNDRLEDADYWNGGTVWVLRDAAGAGAAPEKEYSVINDFATPTVTLRTTLSAAIASGDRYAIARDEVPLHILISKINAALLDLGVIPYTDTATILTVDNRTEYTLPIAASLDLREVWLQTDNTDSDDNRYVLLNGWHQVRSAIGTADTLVLPSQYTAGYKIKLVYMAPHPELTEVTDELSDAIPLERVVYPAALMCFQWLKQRTRRNEYNEDIQRLTGIADRARNTRPIIAPQRLAKKNLLVSGHYQSYPGDRTER